MSVQDDRDIDSATHNDAGDTAMGDGTTDLTHHDTESVEANQYALDNMASNQDLTKTPEPQLAEKDDQAEDLEEDVPLRLFITDLEMQCTTKGFDFPPLTTVRLAVFGVATEEKEIWSLEKVSGNTWKQTLSVIDLSMDIDVDTGLTIVATSEDSIDFARMSLTEDELALDVETDEARITKNFTSGAGVPTLKLSFVVIGLFEDELMDECNSGNESAGIAKKLARRGVDLMEDFERVGNLADLVEAISVQRRVIQLTPNGHADMPTYLNDLGNSFQCRFESTGDLADIEEAISLKRQGLQLIPNGHADIPIYLSNLGNSYLSRFESTGKLHDISEAILVHQRAVQLTPNGHANMPGCLTNLGNSYRCRFERTGNLSDISEAISSQQRAVQLSPNGHAKIPTRLNNLGGSFLRRFERTGDLSDISEAISAQQQAVQLTPNGHADLPMYLNNLGSSYLCRFEQKGDLSDLSEAISAQQRAAQLTLNDHANMPSYLCNLGLSYQRRFERTGHLSDVSEAIAVQQQAVQLTPNSHPNMRIFLNNLGNSYLCRFERTGDLLDISEAISAQKKAVQLTPSSPEMPVRLNSLGTSYQCRFERTGELSDIKEAISCQQRAVQLTPNGHPNMPMYLDSFGNAYRHRFERTGELSDIKQAILSQQRAVQLTPSGHADMPSQLNNLGTSYQCRFKRTGEISDISEAITVQQQVVQLTPNDHAKMPSYLSNLGISYQLRFGHTGELSEISEAISAQQRAVQLTPNGHADMPGRLNNLGVSYQCRFKRTGEISDNEEAISSQQRAVQLTPNGHAHMPDRLNNLGLSYQCRFKRTGEISDNEEAISLQQRAVQLTPNDHEGMPRYLNNFGNSLLCRFERTGNLPDLEQAISLWRQAIQLTPDGHADMPGCLNNLGNSYQSRFERIGDLSDISEAISAQQRAVQLTPNSHTNMAMCLNNLGSSYRLRFEHTGELSEISEAISVQQQVIQLTPNGHANVPMYLNNLGYSYLRRFHHTSDPTDIGNALSIYEKSATTFGPPSARLDAAQKWAELSMTHDLPQSLKAYGVVIDLISQIAGMDRTIEQRHTHLIKISNLTTSAASAAFEQGEIKKALEWLEQGRCLVWSQLNQLRTPVDHLREHDEHLAQRFINISSTLESSGSRRQRNFDIDAPLLQKMSLQDEAHTHVKLAGEWNQLIDEIRGISGFHNFLRPLQTSDLLKDLPTDGPIILINVHETRCDALALISGPDAPVHVPLNSFTHSLASELRACLRKLLSSGGLRLRDTDRANRPVFNDDDEALSEIHFILEELWRRVVKPILDGLGYLSHVPGLSNPRRIWWCPTGPLAFLPLHAAGIYSQNETSPPGSCISDFAISSYTPTVSALLAKVKGSADVQPPSPPKLLIISEPSTGGTHPIPCTTKEMDAIWKTIGSDTSESLCLEAEAATVNRVKEEMGSHNSIHFACHARQDVVNPLNSGFYLHDGRLELAEIMKLKIDHSELAFLSACQTSTGDEELSEEAVHLAAGMLAVGYRSVVATMWSIKDKYGPVVAESYYQYLMDKGSTPGMLRLDTFNAARALHHAIQGIREQVGDTQRGLLTWVPYVHFGY